MYLKAGSMLLVSTVLASCIHAYTQAIDTDLFLDVYNDVFTIRDGSELGMEWGRAADTMQGSVQRLLGVGPNLDILNVSRTLSDENMLKLLFLAVVGNITTYQSSSALPQKCAFVVDPTTGGFVLKNVGTSQSVILEVLLIISIVCLLRAWKG